MHCLIEYQLTLENKSIIPLTDVRIRNTIPFGATFVDSAGIEPQDGEMSWLLPILAPYASTSLTYTVSAHTSLLNNQYTAESNEGATAIGYIFVETNIDNRRPLVGDSYKIEHDGILLKWGDTLSQNRTVTSRLINPTFSNYVPLIER